MYLKEFSLTNYKSIQDECTLHLTQGINIITGPNNTGKSALLQALPLAFPSTPHRSSRSSPSRNQVTDPVSRARARVCLDRNEVVALILKAGGHVRLGAPRVQPNPDATRETIAIIQSLLNQDTIEASLEHSTTTPQTYTPPAISKILGYDSTNDDLQIRIANTTPLQIALSATQGPPRLTQLIQSEYATQSYCFGAERFRIGHSNFGTTKELKPDASNLPEALNILQGTNPKRFSRLEDYLTRVFPSLHGVSVRPYHEANHVEIVLWNEPQDSERDDLTVPLAESGTGISQVLAMLYIIVTSESPRIIAIDEPNSFLHPGATRALVEIMQENSKHQFILTTHSPEVIAASNPRTIHTLTGPTGPAGRGTQIRTLDTSDIRELRKYLDFLDVKLSDIFGADKVLWVEGETEQAVFPKLIRSLGAKATARLAVAAVHATGDFQRSYISTTVEIYRRLSQAGSLFPRPLAFLFDREKLTPTQQRELREKTGGRVFFIKRRCFENYLLHPAALEAVLRERFQPKHSGITANEIRDWLGRETKDAHYGAQSYEPWGADWFVHVDGARLLERLWKHAGDGASEYRKTRDSIAIAEWLIANELQALDEVRQVLNDAIKQDDASDA